MLPRLLTVADLIFLRWCCTTLQIMAGSKLLLILANHYILKAISASVILDKEDMAAHFTVKKLFPHHGFERTEIKQLFQNSGLNVIHSCTGFKQENHQRSGS